MFKLLTPEIRLQVAREYSLRRSVLILTALVAVLMVALIGLLPSYLISQLKQEEIAVRANSTLSTEEQGNTSAWLASFNAKLGILSGGLEASQVSSVIEKVIAERGTGISLTQFNWSEVKGVATLSIVGVARDRQALLAFEKRLKEAKDFGSVTLPVSSLAKESDISFQMNLSLQKTP